MRLVSLSLLHGMVLGTLLSGCYSVEDLEEGASTLPDRGSATDTTSNSEGEGDGEGDSDEATDYADCTATVYNLIEVTGECKPPHVDCEGRTLDGETFGDPQGDCAEGLLCCLDTDQCEATNEWLEFNLQGESFCSSGPCPQSAPITFDAGCPRGERCCIDAGPLNP